MTKNENSELQRYYEIGLHNANIESMQKLEGLFLKIVRPPYMAAFVKLIFYMLTFAVLCQALKLHTSLPTQAVDYS